MSLQPLSLLPGMHIRICFNVHSIIITCCFLPLHYFVKKISGLGDFVFNSVFLCISVSLYLSITDLSIYHLSIIIIIFIIIIYISIIYLLNTGHFRRFHVNFFRKTWYSEKDIEWHMRSLVSCSPTPSNCLHWPKVTCLWIKFEWYINHASLNTNIVFKDKRIIIKI